MMKLFCVALAFIFGIVNYSFAKMNVEEFVFNKNPYFKYLHISYGTVELIAEDFKMLYNSEKEVIYIKHKNLQNTYKLSVQDFRSDISGKIKQNKDSKILLSFKTHLSEINANNQKCLQVYGSKDLYEALGNVGISSMLPLYQAFVYLTGQLQMSHKCQNFHIGKSLDKYIGFPLSVFYKGKEIKFIKRNHYLDIDEDSFITNNAKKIDLQLQYEMMFSLLDQSQRKLFLIRFKKSPIEIKIRAIQNMLQSN